MSRLAGHPTVHHIVFDCDGVLVDSEGLSNQGEAALLTEFGVTLTPHQLAHRFIGTTAEAMWRTLSAEYRFALPEEFGAWYDRRMASAYRGVLEAVPGIREALAGLPVPASCASNSTRALLDLKLDLTGLTPHFAGRVYSANDVARGKPEPDIYLLAAERAGAAPQACVAVEDSRMGARSALAAGMIVLGYTGVHDDPAAAAAALRSVGVTHLFDDMRHLLPLLASLA